MTDKQSEQSVNEEQSIWPDVNDYATWGEYLKDWANVYVEVHQKDRIATNTIAAMSKEELIDCIDQLYRDNDAIWRKFKDTLYAIGSSDFYASRLTRGEIVRRESRDSRWRKSEKKLKNLFWWF